jgi:phenylalanyl-tRNA synthetase alpha chain
LTEFQQYSKYPPVYKDISFWVNEYTENKEGNWNEYNNLCEVIREEGNDLVKALICWTNFVKKTKHL